TRGRAVRTTAGAAAGARVHLDGRRRVHPGGGFLQLPGIKYFVNLQRSGLIRKQASSTVGAERSASMSMPRRFAAALGALAACGCGNSATTPPATSSGLTYYRDVKPILETRCVSCHHDEGIAPFALTDYK